MESWLLADSAASRRALRQPIYTNAACTSGAKSLKVAFRTDASLQMGSGHVMRCLTLADALTVQGAQCNFISRAHPGNLIETIQERGYEVNSLPAGVLQAPEAIKINNTQSVDAGGTLVHAA